MISVACVLLALSLSTNLALGEQLAPEDCGDIQHDVENGMIRLPDFSGIQDINCTWTYTAPAGRKLLVKVDSVHLPPLELRTSQLQLYVDDTFYDIPRNCVKCLRQVVGGKVLTVAFTSYAVPFAEQNDTSDGMGSFQIRYKAFDPHRCGKAEQIDNGYIVNKGRKLGQTVFYNCNPPYDLVGDAELQCKVMDDSPQPAWSNKAPKCVIQDCSGEPIVKKGSSGAIASPGYPTYVYQFTTPCIWEIVAQTSQQIKVSVTYLKFPKHVDNSFTENNSRLLILDGQSNQNILNLTEPIANNPVNFTTLTSKLTVQFVVETDPKIKEETGFYMEYSFVSSSCPKLRPPENGYVISYSADLGSTVSYRCNHGFVLVGEIHAECLFNRQWSHPAPSCEALSESPPPSFIASNNSDTVTDRLDEVPVLEDFSATEFLASKEGFNFNETKELPTVPIPLPQTSLSPPVQTSDVHSSKKDKDNGNGPKSQPHLLQVIPPKESSKKGDTTSRHNPMPPHSNTTLSTPQETLPSLDKGYSQEIDFGLFKLKLIIVYIIAGAGIPIILIITILVIICVYRRKYPVRMRFGRKFSTFENPMYVTKDAQDPRELKRLTN